MGIVRRILLVAACAALAAAWGCGSGEPPLPGAAGLGPDLSRAWAENAAGFDFLPPLHSAKQTSGFNAAAKPVIEIWTGTEAAKGELLKRFEAADITVETDHFHVNWDTNAAAGGLPDGATNCVIEAYWEEANGWDLLGFVDCAIDKSQGKGKKTTDPNYTFALHDGRTLPIKFVIDNTVPAPTPLTITSVTPDNGLPGDEVPVTIAGTGFKPGTEVSLSDTGVTVRDVVVVSTTSITATFALAEDAALGPRDVAVATGHGCTATKAGAFTVMGRPGLAHAPWPKFHQDAYNTGQAKGAPHAPITNTVRWERQIGNTGVGAPVIGPDGTVYIGDESHQFHALDPATGVPKWAFQETSRIGASGAVAGNGTVYVAAFSGKIHALDVATGTPKWSKQVAGGLIHNGLALDEAGVLYFGAHDGKVYAFDTVTQSTKWSYQTGGIIDNSAAALGADGTVYIGSWDGKLYALDGATGALRWRFTTGGWVDVAPVVGPDGTVYFGSRDGRLYAVDGASGSERWRFQTGGAIDHSGPALSPGGVVYCGSDDRRLYAVNAATGAPLWHYQAPDLMVSHPAIGADGTIYVACRGATLFALNPTTGQPRWTWQNDYLGMTSVAIGADGTLYFASGMGKVRAMR